MINLVFCIKSRESFKRITNTLKIDSNFELEDFTPNLETLQENITVKDYDIAVVDEKLAWLDSALDLLNKKGVKIVLFKGDFKKTISDIYSKIPKDKNDLEKDKKHKEDCSQTAASYPDKLYYIKKEAFSKKEEPILPKNTNTAYSVLENKLISL